MTQSNPTRDVEREDVAYNAAYASMRYDSRVWHQALLGAIPKMLAAIDAIEDEDDNEMAEMHAYQMQLHGSVDALEGELAAARLALSQIRAWRISTFQQAEGVRIVVAYDDDADRESSFPVETPMTIGEIIDDYNGTWPHIAIDAAEGAR